MRKILRILQFKNIRTPINTLYREFGVLKLKDLYHFTIRCIVHKFIHSPHLLPMAINEIFCLNEQIHDYNTRNKKDLHPIKLVSTCNGVETVAEKFYHLKFVLVSKSCEGLLLMSGQRSPIDYPFQAVKFRHNSYSPFLYLVFECSTLNYTFN